LVARNILATIFGYRKEPFLYTTIGQLAPIGKRTGVANILGVNFSGFIAWWLWRTIYLMKLPRFEKKVLVALDWTLDVLFSKDLVHFRTTRPPTPPPAEDESESESVELRLSRTHAIEIKGHK
jgi:NADH dehydrogenase